MLFHNDSPYLDMFGNSSAMMYSARCFRCFLRKSRVVRRGATKSKLFTTINGVFLPFLCIICAVWPKAEL
ncbi:hypothetical protein CLOSYM_03873 [[Clostridium] symbiosum ATCC 14940]|uniref:Uncharacterized protein n=1 Tax=[Clostridium] symbiosum ATCC 14940 TaxID=411472 RepID=A0ABC9TTP1_CLOSY|nr:hypothetical protein CLOSYM_03873 [[Clostridium] symbiosum ATCC 14940]